MYEQNLEVCADIIHRQFNYRFFKYINDLQGAELSGADTDAEDAEDDDTDDTDDADELFNFQ